MRGKLDGLPCSDENPSENGFDGRPGGITLLELLNGDRLFMVNTIGGSQGVEDFIDSMHQNAVHHALATVSGCSTPCIGDTCFLVQY